CRLWATSRWRCAGCPPAGTVPACTAVPSCHSTSCWRCRSPTRAATAVDRQCTADAQVVPSQPRLSGTTDDGPDTKGARAVMDETYRVHGDDGEPTAAGGAIGRPAGGRPAGEWPAGGRPAGGRPAGGRPAGGRPAGGRPAGGRPAGEWPAAGRPAAPQPPGGWQPPPGPPPGHWPPPARH